MRRDLTQHAIVSSRVFQSLWGKHRKKSRLGLGPTMRSLVGPRPNLLGTSLRVSHWRDRCLVFILFITIGHAAASSLPFRINTQDKQALQRGARLYMNYCSGCHSLKYIRYNQMAKGLGLVRFDGAVDEPLLFNNLVFTEATLQTPVQVSMPQQDARQWFGVPPPDLSLVARSRGPVWIYAYLQGFYEDAKRPFHSNNLVFPDVGMPDVLAPLRGRMLLLHGETPRLVMVEPGRMTPTEFEHSLQDLITFLVYVGEPTKHSRQMIGIGVLMFLSVLFILLFLLNRMYWRSLSSQPIPKDHSR